jgi:tetratricopeptide (TPR) repeat protein
MTTEKKTHSPRALRFAEAGILFVLLLAVVVTIGVKMNGGDETAAIAETERVDTAELAAAVIEAREAAEASEPVAMLTADVEEPAQETADPAIADPLARYDDASPTVIYQDGEAAYFARSYDEAADLFELYVERRPENAWGRYMLGLSLWKAGASEDAETALAAALDLRPDHVKSLVNLARVRLDLARPDDALPPVEDAIAIDPEYTDGYRVLGRVLHVLGRNDEAVDAYHEALARRSDDPWSLNNLGLIHIESDAPEAALAPLARAAALAPETAVILNNLGMALERSGHTEQAADTYALASDHAKAAANLARLEAFIADGAPAGETLDLAALAASFEAMPRYAAGSADINGVVDDAPDSTMNVDADPAVVADDTSTAVALGDGGL